MTVARLHGPGDLRLHDEPLPVTAAGEVLLRITSVGLCGSDRHWFQDGGIGGTALDEPLVLGHEFAGVIASGPDAGLRVVAEPAVPCGNCRTCRGGFLELCPTTGFAGYGGTDGALRTFATWPATLLQPLPDTIPDDEASLLEPLGIALHAVHLAGLTPGARVAVVGAGPIGQLVIRALVAGGIDDVTVVEPLTHRLAAAFAAGARPARPADADDVDVDVAIECAGEDAAVDTAISLTRPGGRVVLVGIPGDDQTTFTASVARRKGLNLQLCRRMRPDDLRRATELVSDGIIDLQGLVSHIVGLDDVASAFGLLVRRDGHKIVIRP